MDPISIVMGLASVAPGILRWITGDDKNKAASVADQVLDVAKHITGQAEPADAVAAIKADPALAMQLQVKLIEHERAWWEEETKRLAIDASDRENARARELASKDHTTKILALVVVAGFCAASYAVLAGYVEGLKDPLTAALVGTIIGNISAFATQVLNYYLGSSQGSARKDMIAAFRK